ncbi:hypothetical protein FSP39_024958 [Pinctada imbricata]|uniref:Nucleoporin NUP42 n=1 Tax=Pinctada imbricata TaxID=66713 RepID=A0AA88XXJ1_PINIB|nr:hypothetical protein FSP39_024958 [Pinctada imbricata]
MVICKFFMQGNCRYGNSCKFEHPSADNTGYAYSAQRQLFGNSGNRYKWSSNDYQKQQGPKQGQGQVSSADVVNVIINEMTEWEKNKMWPFSCMAFEKEAPCIPDFVDTSPEELRLAAYEALKDNNIQPYIQQVQSLSEEYSKKRQMIRQANLTLRQKLIALIDEYRLKKSRSSQPSGLFSAGSSTNNPFGNQLSFMSSTFGNAPTQPSQGLFGKDNPSTASAFPSGSSGFGTSAFGATPSVGIGSSPAPGAYPSSNSSSQGIFGGNQAAGSFGAQAQPFGSSPTPSAFGATSSAFGATPSQGLFSAGASQSPFGSGASASPSPFGSGANSTSSVGFSKPNTSGTGAFRQSNASGASGQPSESDVTSTVYTPIDKLTPKELAEFKAPHFTLGNLPTKPPPKELCF